jgi:phosphatidylserine synthase
MIEDLIILNPWTINVILISSLLVILLLVSILCISNWSYYYFKNGQLNMNFWFAIIIVIIALSSASFFISVDVSIKLGNTKTVQSSQVPPVNEGFKN